MRRLLPLLLLTWTTGVAAQGRELPALCQDPPFKEGEVARFVARIGLLKVGEGTVRLGKAQPPASEVALVPDLPQRDMWHVTGRVVSTKPVSLFYKVDDTAEVWMRQGSLLPHRQELRVDETNERATRRVLYDHAAGVAHFFRDRSFYRKKKHREGVIEREDALEANAFDPISLVFHLRCLKATAGEAFEVPLHENGKSQTAKIRVERIETIKTPLGRKEAIRARIEVFFEGKLKNKAPFRVWVSNDERRVPLRFVADLKFANLKGVLVGYRPSLDAPVEGKLDESFLKAASRGGLRTVDPMPDAYPE